MTDYSTSLTLFVDDAPSLLRRIKSRLTEIGCKTVEIASSVEEAFRILASGRVGHVVSDWKMPNPGGVAFLNEVQVKYPNMKCTLLTGFTENLDQTSKAALSNGKISIVDKDQLSTAWLAQLVGLTVPPSELDLGGEEVEVASNPHANVSGPADVIAEQRLRIEELERVLRSLAADLIEDLQGIRVDTSMAIIGSKGSLSMRSLVQEIENLSPVGRRLIELDRAARRRLIGAAAKGAKVK
jgi:CheY-like chemotaxis protein